MTRPISIAAAVAAAAVVGVVAAQQQAPITSGQPFPGPGSGILTVGGTVNIGNTPSVEAVQTGEWRVAVTNFPATVSLTPPDFVKAGTRYEITWPAGEREQVAVSAVGPAGWIRVQHTGGARWINVAAARAIQEVP